MFWDGLYCITYYEIEILTHSKWKFLLYYYKTLYKNPWLIHSLQLWVVFLLITTPQQPSYCKTYFCARGAANYFRCYSNLHSIDLKLPDLTLREISLLLAVEKSENLATFVCIECFFFFCRDLNLVENNNNNNFVQFKSCLVQTSKIIFLHILY